MALQIKELTSEDNFKTFLEQIEIPSITAKKYAKSFISNEITGRLILQLIENIEFRELMNLKEIHYFKLLVAVQSERENDHRTSAQAQPNNKSNNHAVKLTPPEITLNCSAREYALFLFNWRLFKKHTGLSPSQYAKKFKR